MRIGGVVLGLFASSAAVAHDDPDHPDHDHDAPPVHHGPDHNQIRTIRFDIHHNMDHNGMVGVGGRFEFAIVPDGFIGGKVHDELALSFGADVMIAPFIPRYYDAGPSVLPVGAVQWNFYLPHDWSVFPEVGVAAHIGFRQDPWRGRHWIRPWPNVGFGARYHFTPRVALLMRVSVPGGFQMGLNF